MVRLEVGKIYTNKFNTTCQIIAKVRPCTGFGAYVGLCNNGSNYYSTRDYNEDGTPGRGADERHTLIAEAGSNENPRGPHGPSEYEVDISHVDEEFRPELQKLLDSEMVLLEYAAATRPGAPVIKKISWFDKYGVGLLVLLSMVRLKLTDKMLEDQDA